MSDTLPNEQPDREWAAFAAIDWADQKHFWKLVPGGSQQSEQGELENTAEAVDGWAQDLNQRFGGRPIAVCLEQSRGALLYMLAKYSNLVLFLVHPTTAARYRETFSPSGAKADPSDTASLLDLLLRHRERLRQWQPDTVETRLLQFLSGHRRRMVNEKTRRSLRLMACLKMYFPQMLKWFDDVSSPLVGALLERWPSLSELQRSHPGTLRKFFRQQKLSLRGAHGRAYHRHLPSHGCHPGRGSPRGRSHDGSWVGGTVDHSATPHRGARSSP